MNILVYDVETQLMSGEVPGGWKNVNAFGLASCVVYSPSLDKYRFFTEPTLPSLQTVLSKAGKRVGWNSIRFDNLVIFGNDCPKQHNDLDLFEEAVKSKFKVDSIEDAKNSHGFKTVFDGSLSLDAVLRATLGLRKTDKGENAPFYYRNGEWAKLLEYNLMDVVRTSNLFKFVCERGYLIDGRNNVIEIDLRGAL